MLTSNGLKLTPDMENRCSLVHFMKRPLEFSYTEYPEGDLLAHIKARQPYYLACVFSILRAWVEAGRPRTKECRHDFRGWAQSLDWIVQNLFPNTELFHALVPLFSDRDKSEDELDEEKEEEEKTREMEFWLSKQKI
jgi:hypothetical protein